MCRCNLNHTCTKFHIYIIICNNWNLSSYKWKCYCFSNHVFISVIIRINCYCSISKHCFRSCCSHFNISATICKRISKMPEMSCLILIFYLCIRNRCKTAWAPVNYSLSTINQILIIEINEYLFNSLITAFIHSKAFSVPIC